MKKKVCKNLFNLDYFSSIERFIFYIIFPIFIYTLMFKLKDDIKIEEFTISELKTINKQINLQKNENKMENISGNTINLNNDDFITKRNNFYIEDIISIFNDDEKLKISKINKEIYKIKDLIYLMNIKK